MNSCARSPQYCWYGLAALLLTSQQAPPAPTLGQVRQAFTAAHPADALACAAGTLFAAPGSVPNVVVCLQGDADLTVHLGRRTVELRLAQYSASYYRFQAYVGTRAVGVLLGCPGQGETPACFDLLVSDAATSSALGGLREAHFIALDDAAFPAAVRQALASGPAAYFAPATLNDKGYLWQQLGHPREARLVLDEVLRRYPRRAVAYLNRGDAWWQLGQLAAAQADYCRYVALLRAQQKDTTRIPAYVRLAVRLPRR